MLTDFTLSYGDSPTQNIKVEGFWKNCEFLKVKSPKHTHVTKMQILAFMSNVKAIQRPWVCTTCCLMVIHRCAKFGMHMSKTKLIVQKQVHGVNETLILRPKVKVTNACDTLSYCDTLEFQMLFGYEEEHNRCGSHTKPCQKPYKFDFEVKGKRRIRNMNVLDTFSHRQTDRVISIYPPLPPLNFVLGGGGD